MSIIFSRLYVLEVCQQRKAYVSPPRDARLPSLNSTINVKEAPQWLDNLNPADILLQEVVPTEAVSERKYNNGVFQFTNTILTFVELLLIYLLHTR